MFMPQENLVTLKGRLAGESYVNITDAGNTLANFTLYVKKPYKDKSGQQATAKVKCMIVSISENKRADNFVKFTTKGSLIELAGFCDSSEYEKNGETIYTQYINVTHFEVLESKEKTEERRKKLQEEK